MGARDFALMVAICLVWGGSTVVSRLVVGPMGIPPLFFAGFRFLLVLLVTLPWLLPVPRPVWRLIGIGLTMGAGGFALLFLGLQTATASGAAVVSQAGVPLTTLLSIVLLGERIHWRRATGVILALVGVLIVIWRPGLHPSLGLLLVLASTAANSLGAILVKGMAGVAPLRLQAWVGLSTGVPLSLASWVFEHDQWRLALAAGWPFWAALAYSVLAVSIFAHTAYYGVIGRHEANLVAPLTLLSPLAAIALGVALGGEAMDARMILGTAIALAGVLIVALRRTRAPVAQVQEHA